MSAARPPPGGEADGMMRASRRRAKRPHDGSIVPAAPNLRWGTDGTMAWTTEDGWVWVFDLIDHYTAEAWAHVAKVGDRFAALQPVYDAVLDRFGVLGADVARGIEVRHNWAASTAQRTSPDRLAGSA